MQSFRRAPRCQAHRQQAALSARARPVTGRSGGMRAAGAASTTSGRHGLQRAGVGAAPTSLRRPARRGGRLRRYRRRTHHARTQLLEQTAAAAGTGTGPGRRRHVRAAPLFKGAGQTASAGRLPAQPSSAGARARRHRQTGVGHRAALETQDTESVTVSGGLERAAGIS